MLFDLRGAGRRRTIKFVYFGLALLMFVGFVGFSVGSSGVSGGIIDAITQGGSGGGTSTGTFQKRADAAQRAANARPKDPAAWATLARARVQLASAGDNFDPNAGTYSAAGKAELQRASSAWERYLSLDPPKPDDRLARLMVQAYADLGNGTKAVRAQEIVTEARPLPATYAQLAILAYQAGENRTADLARGKALDLASKDQKASIKSEIDQAKASAAAAGAQGASGGAGTSSGGTPGGG